MEEGCIENEKSEELDLHDAMSEALEGLDPEGKCQLILESFLTDLDCIREMYEEVVPTLREKDLKRKTRIGKIQASLSDLASQTVQAYQEGKSYDLDPKVLYLEAKNLFDEAKRLHRADEIFKHNSILSIVSRYDRFISDVLRHNFEIHPEQLESSSKQLSYREILEMGSIQEAVNTFIDKEVDCWLRLPHTEKLRDIDQRFKLGVKENIECWSTFVELTERRHLLAHTGGRVTDQYYRICQEHGIDINRSNASLTVDDEYFEKVYRCIYEIGLRLGQAYLRRTYPENLGSADAMLDGTGYKLLESEQWELAKIVFTFALRIPSKLVKSDQIQKLYRINLCIALYHLGNQCEVEAILGEVDWTAAHPKFLLAVHVLRNEYSAAEDQMRRMAIDEPSKEDYLTWPLFKKFRETDEFKRAFQSLYGSSLHLKPVIEMSEKLEKENF